MYPFMPQVMYYVQDWSVIYKNAVRLLRCEIGLIFSWEKQLTTSFD